MRIKKVYLKNFKGIKDKVIINFQSQSSLLIGPNGFGKTTIFDTLELCLTGKIHRTEQKDGVTKHSKDYRKPFFQNEKGFDVIVKVWLTKVKEGKEEDFIITKYLPKNHDGRVGSTGRRNKPTDFDLMRTYREKVKNFFEEDFNPDEAELIKQKDIDAFFDFDENGFEIEQIYNLFNYLQQEETTFFLKMSENDRKDKLGFLFQTTAQEDEIKDMSTTLSKLKDIQKKLKTKIDDTERTQEVNKEEYERIFPEKEFDFDKNNLFEGIDLNESDRLLMSYIKELDKIIQFIKGFSPEEYEKKKTNIQINDILNYS